jgi:hypothetical protein
MLVLFDNGTPRSLAHHLAGHTVIEARARGWDTLTNGELLTAAEADGFDVLITTDKNIRYQQNLAARNISLVVLGQGRWALIRQHAEAIATAVNKSTPGSFTEIDIPLV